MKARAIKFSNQTRVTACLTRWSWVIATSRSTISCITRQIGGPASCHVNERFIDYTITIFIHIYIYMPSVIVCINFLDLEKSSNFVLRPASRHILISETTSLSKNPFDDSKLSPNSIDPIYRRCFEYR